MSAKKKAKPKQESKVDSVDYEMKDLLLKSTLEVANLQRELEVKNEIIIRGKKQIEDQKFAINGLEDMLELKNKDRIDLITDMSRQFKQMQTQLLEKVSMLEVYLKEARIAVVTGTTENIEAQKNLAALEIAKDFIIDEQKMKMDYMTSEFETMLRETLSKMSKKVELVTGYNSLTEEKWKNKNNIQISEANLRRLEDFNLTRLALGSIN